MNIVKIQGGLGNQLFQYTFGLFLEQNQNTESKYDIGITVNDKNFTNRELDIEKLGITLDAASPKAVEQFKKMPKKLWRLERKLAHLFPYFNSKYIVKNDPQYPFILKKNAYYDSYFQRWEYVKAVLDILKSKIDFPKEILESNEEILNKINAENLTAIHIRRDDYINVPVNAKIFEVCDMDYYQKAISYIKTNTETQGFLIFTQDKAWAKEHFNAPEFEIFNGKSAIEDFTIMSKCQHQIIANSTFSWWTAVFNQNDKKKIVYPTRWYKDGRSLKDLINPEWEGI